MWKCHFAQLGDVGPAAIAYYPCDLGQASCFGVCTGCNQQDYLLARIFTSGFSFVNLEKKMGETYNLILAINSLSPWFYCHFWLFLNIIIFPGRKNRNIFGNYETKSVKYSYNEIFKMQV